MSSTGLAQRVEDYLHRLDWALRDLPEAERRRIGLEINSHLAERAGQGGAALDEALRALGPPHDFARAFVETYELSGALNRATPAALLLVVLNRAGRSLLGAVVGFLALMFYILAFGFALVAVAKPFAPRNVGAWVSPHGVSIGLFGRPLPEGVELLGYGVIPLSLLAAVICYVGATALLRGVARRWLGQPAPMSPSDG